MVDKVEYTHTCNTDLSLPKELPNAIFVDCVKAKAYVILPH